MKTRLTLFPLAAAAFLFLSTAAIADRTITVSSMTDSSATLVFGPTDGETYNLYMAYGAADGGGTPADWDHFEELGDIDSNHYHPIEMQEASPDDATLIGSVAQGEA